jgi:small-conductance mechanosensitive channel
VGNAIVINYASRPRIRSVLHLGLAVEATLAQVEQSLGAIAQVFKSHPRTKDLQVCAAKLADTALTIAVSHLWEGGDPQLHIRDLQTLQLELKQRLQAEGIKVVVPLQTLSIKREGRTNLPATAELPVSGPTGPR